MGNRPGKDMYWKPLRPRDQQNEATNGSRETEQEPETQNVYKQCPRFNHKLKHHSSDKLYVALFEYTMRDVDEMGFEKGEHLEIVDNSHPDWWKARSLKTNLEGYVPSNFIAPLSSIEAEPWYFGNIRRSEAENLLCLVGNVDGSFLIRNSESRLNDYSLSVRYNNQVKHYRINQVKNSAGDTIYFISRRLQFLSIQELISHYHYAGEAVATVLTVPCLKFNVEKPEVYLPSNTRDDWEIPRSSLKFVRRLGHGQFGQVHEGLWNEKIPVAIKSLKPGSMDPQDFLEEAKIMKRLHHPKLIRLFAVCTTEQPIYIVTEMMKNGSLLHYLRGRGNGTKYETLLDMAIQVATGMAYLESKNYVHRDLAARNVLVGEKSVVKVADFGLARIIADEQYVARAGTRFPVKWTAPEAIYHSKFSTKSDVWSFGILLSEIITYGANPYPGLSNSEVLEKISDGVYRMPRPNECPQPLYDIMLKTWNGNPMERPTFMVLPSMLEELLTTGGQNYREADEIP